MSYTLRFIGSSRDEVADDAQLGVSVTSFFGGSEDGRCIQLTIGKEYVGLTETDVKRLISTLTLWLDVDVPTETIVRLFKGDE